MVKYNVKIQLNSRTNLSGTKTVRVRVSWSGTRYDTLLPVAIDPKYWDNEGMKVKSTYRPNGDTSECIKANKIISDAKTSVDKFFSLCEVEEIEPTLPALKEWMDPAKDYRRDSPKMMLFADVIEEFIRVNSVTKSWSSGLLVQMRMCQRHMNRFAPHARLGEVDDVFLTKFVDFMYKRGNRNTTVQKRLQWVKWVLNWSVSQGYPVSPKALNYEHKFKGVTMSFREVIYLTWEELMQLRDFDFGNDWTMIRTRDVFLFCCFSGLRYSDVQALKKIDIVDNRIRVITKKTTKAIDIELNQFTKEILAKYDRVFLDGKALPVQNLADFNKNLKKMAELAGLDAPTKKVYYVKSERREEVKPKYEMITSHCARRSFVVNALRLGIPAEVIMSWTGHSDFEAMRPYVKIVDDLKATSMAKFDQIDSPSQMSSAKVNKEQVVATCQNDGEDVGGSCSDSAWWINMIMLDKSISQTFKDDLITIMKIIQSGEYKSQGDIASIAKIPFTSFVRRMQYLKDNSYVQAIGDKRNTRWTIPLERKV